MKALIDGDILRYEVGFAAETAARGIARDRGEDDEVLPTWNLVEEILFERMDRIIQETSSVDYMVFLTEHPTFRDQVAVTKPYKGNRVPKKPWHYDNLSAFMKQHFNIYVARKGLEADDEMALAHDPYHTVICSRDKDLRQLVGYSYSWELGNQPKFGPVFIDTIGAIELSKDRKKIVGTGLAFFYSQLITGDKADNIPGLEGAGAVFAYDLLNGKKDAESMFEAVVGAYQEKYGKDYYAYLSEQGQLLWLVRELDSEGNPMLWEPGDELEIARRWF